VTNLQLFVTCVAIWGSTWIAITFQLGKVAPDASVSYRFLLASLMLFAYCLARRLPLRYTWREHAWIALQGTLMFSLSYIFVYYAEEHIVSGLVAVGYSASPLLGMLGMWAFYRTPMTSRLTMGSLLGIVGIALVFWPEFGRLQAGPDTVAGVIYTALAVVLSTLGSLAAHRNQQAQLPLWQTMAWGMLYGAIFSFAWTLAGGKSLGFDLSAKYVLSLLYLTIFGSIVAFASFLTLLKRIGAARSGYIGVMVPIVALVISAAFESFRWHALTWAGIAISVVGNVVILREKDSTAPR
jgi:drug/metabolite transporter (DMT)-like permease